jgi:hypothetical protein
MKSLAVGYPRSANLCQLQFEFRLPSFTKVSAFAEAMADKTEGTAMEVLLFPLMVKFPRFFAIFCSKNELQRREHK